VRQGDLLEFLVHHGGGGEVWGRQTNKPGHGNGSEKGLIQGNGLSLVGQRPPQSESWSEIAPASTKLRRSRTDLHLTSNNLSQIFAGSCVHKG
jgi:hypothetical protein